jgi:preprotein translocase SecE subunit
MEESWSELRKVTWPTPEQTRNLTILVFVVALAVGIYVSVVDLGFQSVVSSLNDAF